VGRVFVLEILIRRKAWHFAIILSFSEGVLDEDSFSSCFDFGKEASSFSFSGVCEVQNWFGRSGQRTIPSSTGNLIMEHGAGREFGYFLHYDATYGKPIGISSISTNAS
jgi:hypothetical protein